jgi:hypothetical protein
MDPLDALPLEVLLAMQEALGDPTTTGQERASQRAADAGFYLQCTSAPSPQPIPMPPAVDGIIALALSFDGPSR